MGGERRNLEHIRQHELCVAVFGVLFQKFFEDLARLRTVAVEEILPRLAKLLGALPAGALAANRFLADAGGVATTVDHRFIYETDTGWLSYDANGSVAGGAVHIAKLGIDLPLTNADFMVI